MRKSLNLYSLISIISLSVFNSCIEVRSEDKLESIKENVDSKSFNLPPLPKQIYFCQSDVKLENFDVRERLDKELIVNTFYHSSTIQLIKKANRYFKTIEKILRNERVPDDFKYLCLIESGLDQVTSPLGAKGFWQFMPETALQYGLKINNEIDERLNVERSTTAACAYLKDANAKFDNWILTAASYNRGMIGISNDLKEQGVTDYFDLHLNNETSRYVFRILALKIIFENQINYGFNEKELELYEPLEKRSVVVTESIEDLKMWAIKNKSNYRMLKLFNPWLINDYLTVNDTSYTIELPK